MAATNIKRDCGIVSGEIVDSVPASLFQTKAGQLSDMRVVLESLNVGQAFLVDLSTHWKSPKKQRISLSMKVKQMHKEGKKRWMLRSLTDGRFALIRKA